MEYGTYIKYADFSSRDEDTIMLFTLAGGASLTMFRPFMGFRNSNRSYPIQGILDNILGVAIGQVQRAGWTQIFSKNG